MTAANIISAFWTGDDMALRYEDCKTKEARGGSIINQSFDY